MTYYISFSGGTASAVTAILANELGLDYQLLFADTLIEDEDLYRFIYELSDKLKKPLIHLKDGRTPWDVFIDKKFIGNTRIAPCSYELKTKPIRAWLAENSLITDPLVLGMDWSEMDRITRAQKAWSPRPVVSLLNEYGVTRPMFDEMLGWHNIRKPRLYELNFLHNNCFHGDTRFITSEGLKTLIECVDKNVVVLGKNGGWKDAQIKSFGSQEMVELTLQRYGITKTIMTTMGHRWFVRMTRDTVCEVMTRDLPVDKKLVSNKSRLVHNVRPSAFGIAHGIVYGDGTAVEGTWNNPAKVVLCGEKAKQLLKWFPNSPTGEIKGVGIEVRDLPRDWKQAPNMAESQSYLYGWLAGYFAADGSYTGGEARVSSAKRASLETVENVCAKLGITTSPIRSEKRIGTGTEATMLHSISLSPGSLRKDFFLLAEHRRRFTEKEKKLSADWTIKSVVNTGVVDEVFCAVVPDGHAFTLEGNILTGNCGGFCCRAGLKQFKNLLEVNPERYEYHANAMDDAIVRIGKTAKPFLRSTSAGVTEYLTLNEYRNRIDTVDASQSDLPGCGCFVDDD